MDINDKKAVALFVPVPMLKAFQKFQPKLVRELEKKLSEENSDTKETKESYLDQCAQGNSGRLVFPC